MTSQPVMPPQSQLAPSAGPQTPIQNPTLLNVICDISDAHPEIFLRLIEAVTHAINAHTRKTFAEDAVTDRVRSEFATLLGILAPIRIELAKQGFLDDPISSEQGWTDFPLLIAEHHLSNANHETVTDIQTVVYQLLLDRIDAYGDADRPFVYDNTGDADIPIEGEGEIIDTGNHRDPQDVIEILHIVAGTHIVSPQEIDTLAALFDKPDFTLTYNQIPIATRMATAVSATLANIAAL